MIFNIINRAMSQCTKANIFFSLFDFVINKLSKLSALTCYKYKIQIKITKILTKLEHNKQ